MACVASELAKTPPLLKGIDPNAEPPCIRRLYKQILQWDYFKLSIENETDGVQYEKEGVDTDAAEERAEKRREKDDRIAAAAAAERGSESKELLRSLPSSFGSSGDGSIKNAINEYRAHFEPLLLEECAAQLTMGAEDGEYDVCRAAINQNWHNPGVFSYFQMTMRSSALEQFVEGDIVLVSAKFPGDTDASEHPHTLGLMCSSQGENSMYIAVFLESDSQVQSTRLGRIRMTSASMVDATRTKMLSETQGGDGGWHCCRLCNLATILREWSAVNSIEDIRFADTLLSGSDADAAASCSSHPNGDAGDPLPISKRYSRTWEVPEALMEQLQANYDPTQMKAILSSLTSRPVVLIQGPPGTGKTRTLLGLLSVILQSKPYAGTYREREDEGDIEEQIKGATHADTRMTDVNCAQDGSGDDGRGHKAVKGRSVKGCAGASAGMRTEGADVEMGARKKDHTNTFKRGMSPWLYGDSRDWKQPILPWEVPRERLRNLYDPKPGQLVQLSKHNAQRVRILVCAPSNGAVDEIVMRLMEEKLFHEDGSRYSPKIVRIGVKIHDEVKGQSMEHLAAEKLKIMRRSTRSREAAMTLDGARLAVLNDAQIVCTTLSYSGANIFKKMDRGFDVVVIDEAAQAVEPSTLIPLQHGCKQVFLVGDPVQLPATVLSSRAVEKRYDTSLFERFQKNGYAVNVLQTQYRMHPSLRAFPSRQFYRGMVKDGEGVEFRTVRYWHARPFLGPLSFVDVSMSRDESQGTSWSNRLQSDCVIHLVRALLREYPNFMDSSSALGIISPYKGQVQLIRDGLDAELTEEQVSLIDVNSVDGFQGREKDIIIYCTVRTRRKGRIGFLKDKRRLNVAITRAKASLIVIGDAAALNDDESWRNLIQDVKQNGCMFPADARKFNDFLEDWLAQPPARKVVPVSGKHVGLSLREN